MVKGIIGKKVGMTQLFDESGKVIISTNLSLEDCRNRYQDRIFSRIASNFEFCKLTGPDIRMCKKVSAVSGPVR